MNAALVHLEKIVFGSAGVVSLAVVLLHLSEGNRLRRVAGTVTGGVEKLDAALKDGKAPGAAGTPTFVDATPAIETLTGGGPAPAPTSAWAFHRRPTLRGKPFEPPDLRKDLFPPAEVSAKVENFTVIVTWAAHPATTAVVQGWRVYRYPAAGKRPEKPVAELAAGVLKWEDPDAAALEPGSTWRYEVTSITGDETKQGGTESAAGGPATATLPYDRRLHYYGGALVSGQGAERKVHSVTVAVSRFANGDWRGPEEFSVKPGERIGGVKAIEIDGERVDVDFTTRWTLKSVEQSREEVVVDGQPRVVEKDLMVVVDDAAVETRVAKSDKPRVEVVRGPRTPFDAELQRLLGERNAARAGGDHDVASQIAANRDWLSQKRLKYLRGTTIVTERVEADVADFTAQAEALGTEIAELEASGRRARAVGLQRKKAELEARVTILQNLLKK